MSTPEQRSASAARNRAYRARNAAAGLPEDDPRHGTFSAYTNLACRCTRCRRANADHQREFAARHR